MRRRLAACRRCGAAVMAVALILMVPSPALGATGTIGGTARAGETPLSNTIVTLTTPTGEFVARETTDSLGRYSLTGIAAGEYVVHFDPYYFNVYNGTKYVSEYYGGAYDIGLATTVPLEPGAEISGIDADIGIGGWLSGTVAVPGSTAPLSHVNVFAYRVGSAGYAASTFVLSDGQWQIDTLVPGQYHVMFSFGLVNEYYDDALTREEAMVLSVPGPGLGTPDINAVLETTGNISGTVTDGTDPLPGIVAQARNVNTGMVVGQATTDASGRYLISGLPVNSYKLHFDTAEHNSASDAWYIAEYYDDQLSLFPATTVKVFGGRTAEGKDAVLTEGGTISGRVTLGGTGRSDVLVLVSKADTADLVLSVRPGTDGTYHTGPVSPGEYVVEFRPDASSAAGMITEYYDDARVRLEATAVSVVTRDVATGVDAQMEQDTLVAGVVYGDRQPLAGVDVYALAVGTSEPVGWALTDSAGRYEIPYLPPGWYAILADPEDYNAGHGTEFEPDYYHGGWAVGQDPPLVQVKIRDTQTQALDLNLVAWTSSISGRVTSASGSPLAGIDVWASCAESGYLNEWGFATTDANGHYTISGLIAGRHVVEFDPEEYNLTHDPGYRGEYYDSADNAYNLTYVNVTHAQTTPNINATLDPEYPDWTPVQMTDVHRFYNLSNGTHFYTPDPAERDMIIRTWPNVYRYEGIAYQVNPHNNTQPLYRFYNRKVGSHFFTASPDERDMIIRTWPHVFTYEGETYKVSTSPVLVSFPVYRFYNKTNGSHFFTASPRERDSVIRQWPHIYQYEGVAFHLGQ